MKLYSDIQIKQNSEVVSIIEPDVHCNQSGKLNTSNTDE